MRQSIDWEQNELNFSYNIIKSTDSNALVSKREEAVIKLPLMNELCEYYEKHKHKALIMTA